MNNEEFVQNVTDSVIKWKENLNLDEWIIEIQFSEDWDSAASVTLPSQIAGYKFATIIVNQQIILNHIELCCKKEENAKYHIECIIRHEIIHIYLFDPLQFIKLGVSKIEFDENYNYHFSDDNVEKLMIEVDESLVSKIEFILDKMYEDLTGIVYGKERVAINDSRLK